MAKLRVLGVGAGYFSQFQYLGWRNIAEVECVGIVNRDTAKARAMADRFAGGWLEWDRKALRFTNQPAATQLVRREYRDGWKVEGLG